MSHGLRAYDGLSLPEDAETISAGRAGWSYSDLSDDEDFLADEASGGEHGLLVAGSGGVRGKLGFQEACPRCHLKKWAKKHGQTQILSC